MANKTVRKDSVPKETKFNPASLSYEEAGLVLEQFLGAHPRYFYYETGQIKIDRYSLQADGHQFNGFLPHLVEVGIVKKEDYAKRFK